VVKAIKIRRNSHLLNIRSPELANKTCLAFRTMILLQPPYQGESEYISGLLWRLSWQLPSAIHWWLGLSEPNLCPPFWNCFKAIILLKIFCHTHTMFADVLTKCKCYFQCQVHCLIDISETWMKTFKRALFSLQTLSTFSVVPFFCDKKNVSSRFYWLFSNKVLPSVGFFVM